MNRSNPFELKRMGFTPKEKITNRPVVGPARVRIPDLCREKFNIDKI